MKMVRAIVVRGLDPIDEEVEFLANVCRLNAVPAPNARIDLLEAFAHAQRDIDRCLEMLADDPSGATFRQVEANTMAWLRFWSVREPMAVGRERAAEELRAWEEQRIDGE
jgi:hypothetical protein